MSTTARNKRSVMRTGLQLVLFAVAGAAPGAVCLGIGVYLSSFTDRVEAFTKPAPLLELLPALHMQRRVNGAAGRVLSARFRSQRFSGQSCCG